MTGGKKMKLGSEVMIRRKIWLPDRVGKVIGVDKRLGLVNVMYNQPKTDWYPRPPTRKIVVTNRWFHRKDVRLWD